MTSLLQFRIRNPQGEVLGLDEGKIIRRDLLAVLTRVMPWLPSRNLPRGRVNDYLWNYLPEDLPPTSARLIFDEWKGNQEVLICIPEDPWSPVYQVKASDVNEESMEGQDLYIIGTKNTEVVWIFDHEGYGPWRVSTHDRFSLPQSMRRRFAAEKKLNPSVLSRKDSETYCLQNSLEGAALEGRKSSEIRTTLKKKVRRKDIYVPKEPLLQGPVICDYFPKVLEFEPSGNDPYRFILDSTEKVILLFESRRAPCWEIESSSLHPESLTPEDIYILDWPRQRWLLAIPKEYQLRRGDNYIRPTYLLL